MSQNYKDTLNLPRTDFPMKANLAAREPEMLKKWEETRLYQQIQKSREGRELFVLHDGPPFANGDVHMGTALNKILKDFVVKSQTMLGKRAPYVPGWDCHGLPIEYKVVKESRGLSPLEVRKKSRGVRAQIHRHPARAIQAARRVRRLGKSVSDDGSQIRSGNLARVRGLRGEGPGLRIEEAGLLEHRRADRPGRSRSGISGARRHRRLREVSDRERTSLERAKRASPSGRRRPGRCRRTSPSRCIRRRFTSSRNFRADGTCPKRFVLAEKLVPQFCCSHRIRSRSANRSHSFPGSKLEGIRRATSVSGSRRPSCSPPIL